MLLWTECLCPPQNYAETLVPSAMVFEDGSWLGHKGKALVMGLEPLEEKTGESLLPLSALRHERKRRDSLPQAEKQDATRTWLLWWVWSLIRDLQPPELWEIHVLFKLASLWYFVTAGQADSDTGYEELVYLE